MYVSPTGSIASLVCPICSSYSSGIPNVSLSKSIDCLSESTAIAMCSTRLIFMCPPSAREHSAREEFQHQAVHVRRVLVGAPVAGARHAMDVQRPADSRADLADQQIGGAERGVVARAPEHAKLAAQRREVAEQRPARAPLAA